MRVYFYILAVLLFAFPASAREVKPDYEAFGAWPVLHEGRIKTMDSLARSVFFDISGTTHLNGTEALEWLAQSLFEPSSTIAEPYVEVGRNTILDLPEDEKYYSMAQVMTAMNPYEEMILKLEQRDPAEYTSSQKDLMHTYRAVSLYNQVIQSFSAVLPLKGENNNKNFLDGGGSHEQRELIVAGGMENGLIKFIDSDNPSMPKISLWEALGAGVDSPVIADIAAMAAAWNEGDYARWNELAVKTRDMLQGQIENPAVLNAENIYISIQPILWAIGFYALAVAVYFVSHKAAVITACIGFFAHIAALGARSYIMMRPPTGTLYETMLFAALIIMLTGIALYVVNRKNAVFTVLCSAAAAFLLFVSRGFIQGDSLNVLAAVLKTNFWLSTHVTCIIIGYGFCIMAALVAHFVLAFENDQMKKILLPLALAALLFTSVGTLLGGIWADQSWGRFWGWDPKENGALLIVLWLSWVLHGRVSGHFAARGFAAALAMTNVMVALTWFGVNLLGVGLHSYGFISGIAWGLGGFIILQSAVVAFLYFLPRLRGQNA